MKFALVWLAELLPFVKCIFWFDMFRILQLLIQLLAVNGIYEKLFLSRGKIESLPLPAVLFKKLFDVFRN